LKISPVSTVEDVLKFALTKPLTPIEWIEPVEEVGKTKSDAERGIVTH
jgi:ATP-dependent Lon protease